MMQSQCVNVWLAVSNIVLSVVIGGIAVFIARQQWQTARQKLRLDLFDRRYAFYESLKQMIDEAQSNKGDMLATLGKYLTTRTTAQFLLHDDAIDKYVSRLFEQLRELYKLRYEKHAAAAPAKDDDAKIAEIEAWLGSQSDVIVGLFRRHLNISD